MTYSFDEIIDRRHANVLNTDGFWGCFVHAAEYAGNASAHCLRDQRRTSAVSYTHLTLPTIA